MRRLKGVGLPNVYLLDGVLERPDGAIAYRDLDGLYQALAGAIAMRSGALTGPELRFLRKSLDMTQEDVGRLGDKSSQIAAKWEKGSAPVPLAESNMLRLIWLERFNKRYLAAAVRAFIVESTEAVPCDYVMRFVEGEGWREDIAFAQALAVRRADERLAQALIEAMDRGGLEGFKTIVTVSAADEEEFVFDAADSAQSKEMFT
ncbi:hypothetical protein [Variovorax paradoxus]|uniref:hypothetical protein n=1 Tax=Variovorax paradoxus TaxID=34073 RepID=UPI0029C68CE9|nr:hypothetical protein RZE77_03070 [Variovorax paradoxus]